MTIPVLLSVTSITYLTMAAAAGDYIPGLYDLLGGSIQPGDVDRLRVALGLDRPLHEQYFTWLFAAMRGDLGLSLLDRAPISDLILQRLPFTLELSFAAILLSLSLAIPMGVLGALHRGGKVDALLNAIAVTGYAVPQFWLGLILILLFAVAFRTWGLPSLPAGGAVESLTGGDPVDLLRHLILPAITLSTYYVAVWSRFVRSSVIGVIAEDYVRTARAKGLSENRVLYGHALRSALLPLITLLGLELPRLASGALVTEVIFSWPGVGRLAYERAIAFDYPAVMGVTAFVAVAVVLGNVLADIAYAIADPRVRVN